MKPFKVIPLSDEVYLNNNYLKYSGSNYLSKQS